MSWECPHKSGDYCPRVKRECVVGQKGCVLAKNYHFPLSEPDKEEPFPKSESDPNL